MSPRGQRLSEHLPCHEVACRCGCGYGLAAAEWPPEVGPHFELIRYFVGRPLWVTSGARCDQHNEDEKGVENSGHTRLVALDLAVSHGRDRIELIVAATFAALVESGAVTKAEALELYRETIAAIRGIGVANGFIHTDLDGVKPRPAAWSY